MAKRISLLLGLMAMLALLAACGIPSDSGSAQLGFEARMNVDSGGRFHVSLGVRNLGDDPFRDYGTFNGAMALRDASGAELGHVQVTTLWELAPGGAGWPATYASRLPPGTYQLTWGAPAYSSVTVDFTIVELEGRLYLGQEAIRSTVTGTKPDEGEHGALQSLVDLARVNLAQRLGVQGKAVTVQSVEAAQFPDASLGIAEPGQDYAQVLTPGYILTLAVEGQAYEYRASDSRLIFVPPEGAGPQGSITVEGVQVSAGEQMVVHGRSTLPDGTCLGSELWADGALQAWWPGEVCAPIRNGAWQMAVQMGAGTVPAELDPVVQYTIRVFQQNGPDVVSVFPFDLAGPPAAEP